MPTMVEPVLPAPHEAVEPATLALCGREVGLGRPLFLIAGPCVIESEALVMRTAETLATIAEDLDLHFIFKSSFDKANRTSGKSFRGPGIDEGLRILERVREQVGVPVLTDVHDVSQIDAAAQAVDVLQTPAFLARQTDFIEAVASVGRPVNIKKAQFMAPADMQQVVDKARAAAARKGRQAQLLVCERGVSFGYNNLISDMRSLSILRETGCPVVFDATHSVQLPGGLGGASGGQREFVPLLARAAVASGIAGLFMETHPHPEMALSDGPNAWPLARMAALLALVKAIDALVKRDGFAELDLAESSAVGIRPA
jgi:2-dehydro-3-deoxyphosphooctonate aldolase (KDO 8-P synthase)